MKLVKIDIDELLESTADLTFENNNLVYKQIEIDRLLEQTRK
ncbi:hypothetical protein [Niallia sp. Krafla_26]